MGWSAEGDESWPAGVAARKVARKHEGCAQEATSLRRGRLEQENEYAVLCRRCEKTKPKGNCVPSFAKEADDLPPLQQQ